LIGTLKEGGGKLIVELKDQSLFEFSFPIGDKKLGVFRGAFYLSSEDRKVLIDTANLVWERITEKSGINNFLGHIRFDFVPRFEGDILKLGKNGFDLGSLRVVGIYEINVHSPECTAAVTMFRKLVDKKQPDAVSILTNEIRNTFGKERIVFVPGNGIVKRSWGDIFFGELKKYLKIVRMQEEEVMRHKPYIIWRWGDARITGPSEYSYPFIIWLIKHEGVVFNTVPQKKEEDLGNKIFLMSDNKDERWDGLVGRNRSLDSPEVLEWAVINRKNLVLKPLLGSSGRNVIFGKDISPKRWEKILRSYYSSDYGLYEARWLPKIKLPGFESFTFDVNCAFWASGRNIKYLYTVIRVDSWNRYWQRGTINLAQGAGFAGACYEIY
jgi:hypothetical protein